MRFNLITKAKGMALLIILKKGHKTRTGNVVSCVTRLFLSFYKK